MGTYLVRQHVSIFNGNTVDEIANPKQVVVSSLHDIENIPWVKQFAQDESFIKFSVSPYITGENVEEFFLMAERGVTSWAIVARVTCLKEEALEVFPLFVKPEPLNHDKNVIDVEVREIKEELPIVIALIKSPVRR